MFIELHRFDSAFHFTCYCNKLFLDKLFEASPVFQRLIGNLSMFR